MNFVNHSVTFIIIITAIALILTFAMVTINGIRELFTYDPTLNDVKIYLINLDRNKERLYHFDQQYARSDLSKNPYERIQAVDGNTLDISKLVSHKAHMEILQAEKSGFRTKHYQLTRGAVGCYLSHLNVYRKLIADDAKMALIFEDDVVFQPTILLKMQKHVESIPKDWDLILLGCHCIVCKKNRKFSKLERFFFMHAYLITQTAAKKILAYLKDRKIDQQIDSVLGEMARKQDLNIYCINDSLAKQSKSFTTTIQLPLKRVSNIDPYAVR
jgi:glycosyl transferase, family 25